MVGIPSLTKICVEELRLDDVAQKRLRADAKEFRAACVSDIEGSGRVMSNKEMAMRYLANGYPAKGIKPGGLLWQTLRPNTDGTQHILPRDDEIVLRGVERVFGRMERYARDKRRTHGRTTSGDGQASGYDEEDEDLPEVSDLVDALQRQSALRGQKGSVDHETRRPACATGNQGQTQPLSQTDQASGPAWDDDIPLPPENPKDKEYEPSGRLSDEPRRLPATRKETERRKQLPPSQRSRESTLIPVEDAINRINKRRRSAGGARASSTEGVYEKDIMMDTETQQIQGADGRRQRRKVRDPHVGMQEPSPQPVEWKPRVCMSSREPSPTHSGSASLGKSTLRGKRVLTDVTASYSPHQAEIPDSPQSTGRDRIKSMPAGEGDDRSLTFIARRGSELAEDDEGSRWRDTSSQAQDSVELDSITGEDQAHALRQSPSDEVMDRLPGDISWQDPHPSLPPNIWILTTKSPTLIWSLWNKTSLDAVTLSAMTGEVQRNMGLNQLTHMKIKFSDRQQEWRIVLHRDDESRYQDIKVMLMKKTRIRDVWYSPAYPDL